MSTPRQTKDDRFDKVVTMIYGQLNERINRTALSMRSQKAPGQKRVPPQEQLSNYLKIRNDPNAWQQIISKRGVKSALRYRKQMEKLLKKTITDVEKQLEEEAMIPGFAESAANLSLTEPQVDPAQIVQTEMPPQVTPGMQPQSPVGEPSAPGMM